MPNILDSQTKFAALLIMIITGMAGVAFAQDTKAIERARDSFTAKIEAIDRDVGDKKINKLLVKAIMALDALKSKFQQAGDLSSFQAVMNETQRLAKEKRVEEVDLVGAPKALRSIQLVFQAGAARINREVAGQKDEVRKNYLRSLKERQIRLTKAGKIDAAIVFKDEIDRVNALDFELGGPTLVAKAGVIDLENRRNAFGPYGLGRPLGLGFIEFDSKVYRRMGHELMTYSEAKARAVELGGELASLETEREFEFAKSIVNWEDLRIALERRNGQMVWANGKPYTLKRLFSGELRGETALMSGRHRGTVVGGTVGLGWSASSEIRRSWLCEWASRKHAEKALREIQSFIERQKSEGVQRNGRTYASPSLRCRSLSAFEYAQSLGGQVVVPENLETYTFVRRMMSGKKFWIGVTDCIEEGTWVTSRFQPVMWTPWAVWSDNQDEPNNQGGAEHFAVTWPNQPHGASWIDVNGQHLEYPFVIQW